MPDNLDQIELGETSPTDSPASEKAQEIEYIDSSAQLWSVVLSEGEKYDKILAESWKGDMDGILIFAGLFSAAVAAFIIEVYKRLSQDSGDTTAQALTQISQQLAASAAGSQPPLPAFSQQPFEAPRAILHVNILWFLSLILSISCALAATLVQQWSRRYILTTQLPSSPQRRARVRTYLFKGVRKFKLGTIANAVPFLLHISVFLFFAGLVIFLFQINNSLAYVVLAAVVVCALVYVGITAAPLFHHGCPYQTPMSGPLWRFCQALQLAVLALVHSTYSAFMPTLTHSMLNMHEYSKKCKKRLLGGLQHDLERNAMEAAQDLDTDALQWTLQSLQEPGELEEFIASIPGFLGSTSVTPTPAKDATHLTSASVTLHNLLHVAEVHLGLRIGHLLKARMHAPVACIDAVWHLTRWYDGAQVFQWDRAFGEPTVDALRALKAARDPAVALTARCAAALATRVVLRDMRRVLRHTPAKRLRMSELLKILDTLMDSDTPASPNRVVDEEFVRDAHVLNVAGVVTGIVPLFMSVEAARAEVLWDTLGSLTPDLDVQGSSSTARHAFITAWDTYEAESSRWAESSFPLSFMDRRPPVNVDITRYAMQLQATTPPVVQRIKALRDSIAPPGT
ncbi:hypothetical protein BC834DRAFT_631459 [Gloeopeniophorella convolvens]|nr:hypothetical protein BC834DRAFT_631459 [Gloeopeniophorella convolvens]